MDIRQLIYFQEVANQVSFSKASKRLHLTQPTLSKMVKNLEDELGVMLLDRSTRRVHLTEAGEIVLNHAHIIRKTLEDLHTALEDLVQQKKGDIVLGLPPVVGVSFFPEIIVQFRKLYPQISIQLIEEGGKMMEQLLLEGGADLGVAILPVDGERFEVLPLVERDLTLIVHPQHPLAEQEEVLLRDLAREPFIVFRQGFTLYDRVREACIGEGFEPKIVFESSQWDFISEMVSTNLGIAFLPETVCNRLDPKQIRLIRNYRPKIQWKLALVWRKNKYLPYAVREWIQYVKGVFDTFQEQPCQEKVLLKK